MNEGKIFSRLRYSGLERSGDVHVRRYCSSESSNRKSPRDEVRGFSPSGETGLGGSSPPSEVKVESSAVVFPEDWDDEDATDRERLGVSKNGSLGARRRLGWTVVAMVNGFWSDGSGWDCEREWGVGGVRYAPKLFEVEERLAEDISSKARTWGRNSSGDRSGDMKKRLTPLRTSIASSIKSLPLRNKVETDQQLIWANLLLWLTLPP
jgi:hypothetical protein